VTPEQALLVDRCARAAIAAYNAPATLETADVHALLIEEDGALIVALRGTNPEHLVDLWRDAGAAIVRDDPILGPVPESFASDAEQLLWRLLPRLHPGKRLYLTGHSKGASEAQILAAMLGHIGFWPDFVAAFEPAPVGTLNGAFLGQAGLATRLGLDPIVRLPSDRPHAQPLLQLDWPGAPPLDPLRYHAMANVRAALDTYLVKEKAA
jgi:hypothetical protein